MDQSESFVILAPKSALLTWILDFLFFKLMLQSTVRGYAIGARDYLRFCL